MTPSIIFDFDGTLAIGHGPVLAYARLLAPAAAPGFLQRVEAELVRYDNGATDFRDGYNIVASLGAADGVPEAIMAAAYTNSRAQLGTAQAPVESMPELKAVLSALGQYAHLVLATNAPGEGVDRVLANWNVQDRFDEQHFNVGKPAGLYNIVESALDRGPVLAIGDIAEYDLAPALQLGADTALVGATAMTSTAPVTMRGASLEHLASDIQTWAAQAANHSDTVSTFSER
ncbi:MAG: HAD family hydrolase [Yaniella sp.]|uniref:HAD family hydrolase n=1 Tax=Yaniella sp. TaxID=2773929 RepID=UPI002648136D|nr:HAD family hydrolase [Yaniella sp.]MDN5732176.1 HAD family hydrolase [Yaniella sp.]MDN5742187.1 HAD family hydrolase [Yaniella sp.]MDN5816026.1 HAD family hydrolase [Yaniella sp.]MDN5818624.1 HAD family hydrolase [Yaniella sp.]MDN5838480.1 HAD family hydrolase [Yaniella sp.]